MAGWENGAAILERNSENSRAAADPLQLITHGADQQTMRRGTSAVGANQLGALIGNAGDLVTGLAIVGKILEEHGGKLELFDAPDVAKGGRGAWMRLRFAAAEIVGGESSESEGTRDNSKAAGGGEAEPRIRLVASER